MKSSLGVFLETTDGQSIVLRLVTVAEPVDGRTHVVQHLA